MANDSTFSNLGLQIRSILEADTDLLAFYAEAQHELGGKRMYFTDEDVVFPSGDRPEQGDCPILLMYPSPIMEMESGGQRIWHRDFPLTIEIGVYDSTSQSKKLLRFVDIITSAILKASKLSWRVDGDPHGMNGKIVEFDIGTVVTTLGPPGDERGRADFQAAVFEIVLTTALDVDN